MGITHGRMTIHGKVSMKVSMSQPGVGWLSGDLFIHHIANSRKQPLVLGRWVSDVRPIDVRWVASSLSSLAAMSTKGRAMRGLL